MKVVVGLITAGEAQRAEDTLPKEEKVARNNTRTQAGHCETQYQLNTAPNRIET